MNRRKFLGVCAGAAVAVPVLAKSDTEWAEGYIKGIKAHKKHSMLLHEAPRVELVPSLSKEHICVKQSWKDRKSDMAKYTWHRKR